MLLAAVRNLLGSVLRLQAPATVPGRIVVATNGPDEIDVLGAAVLAASGGLDVVYLGAGSTADDLLAATISSDADVVALGGRDERIEWIRDAFRA